MVCCHFRLVVWQIKNGLWRGYVPVLCRDGTHRCKEQARSHVRGHFLSANRLVENGNKPPALPTNNGAIHTLCQIIKTVVSSAAESEIGAKLLNAKDDLPIRTTLEELRHPQPPTPMQVDNTTAVGFANNTIKQKRSNVINMRFYWVWDRTGQGQFKIYWAPGSTNLGDYHTKHHYLKPSPPDTPSVPPQQATCPTF